EVGITCAARLLPERVLVARELRDVETGLERAPVPGVDDHPDRGVVVELAEHRGVHRVARVGPVEHQPADGAAPLDDERLVRAHERGTSRQAAPCHGSGSRGSPSTRSPTPFLLISVVPPSIVFARLRSMPATSYGSVVA